MRRPKPQPQVTRLPRLRDAKPSKRGAEQAHAAKSARPSRRRVTPGKTIRLRIVHPD